MNREESKVALYGDFLTGCPCRLFEKNESGDRVVAPALWMITGYDKESWQLVVLSKEEGYFMCDACDVVAAAHNVAVLEDGTPLFFMDEESHRVFCSPNIRKLHDLSAEITSYNLALYLSRLPLSGDYAVVRSRFDSQVIGHLEYCDDGMYEVTDIYEISEDKKDVFPSDVKSFHATRYGIISENELDLDLTTLLIDVLAKEAGHE